MFSTFVGYRIFDLLDKGSGYGSTNLIVRIQSGSGSETLVSPQWFVDISGEARDALINLIMKNCPYNQLDWAEKLLKTDAYYRLMEVASELNLEEFRWDWPESPRYGFLFASFICCDERRNRFGIAKFIYAVPVLFILRVRNYHNQRAYLRKWIE